MYETIQFEEKVAGTGSRNETIVLVLHHQEGGTDHLDFR